MRSNATRFISGLAQLSLVLSVAGVGSWGALGATRTAASASYADVFAAYNLCNNGDTLVIPAGTPTWTQQLTVAKALTIRGAGKYSTVLKNGINQSDWHGKKPLFYITGNGTGRVTEIGFDGNWTSGGKGILVLGTTWRIDNCYFYRCNDRGIQTYSTSGLIDHCVFLDCVSSASHYADNYNAWNRALGIGTTNCWVMEDCYDTKVGTTGGVLGADGGHGARYVWRFNTLSNTVASGFDYALDAHGNQSKPFGDPATVAGTVFIEAYHNTFSLGTANRGNYLRGGTHIFYGNTYRATGGNMFNFGTVWMMTEEDGYRFGNPIRTAWPGYMQITNTYLWGNTYNGAAATGNNVILESPGTTPCTNPAGCGAGWPSDGIFIQYNRDWFMKEPPAAFYRPLPYPHPRIVAENDPPIPPTFALVSPANAATQVSTSPTLMWNDTTGETGYRLWIARDYFFTDRVVDVTLAPNTTSYTPTLNTTTTYYWLVRATSANGVNTSANAPYSFTTAGGQAPATPVNSSPSSGATGISLTPTLTGSSYSDPGSRPHLATQFRVFANDGVTLVWDSGSLGPVTSVAVASGQLTYQTTYKWAVRYQNNLGLWSSYSTQTAFTTLLPSAPATPVNSSPANGATNIPLSPTLSAIAFSDPNGSSQTGSQWRLVNGTNVIDSGSWLAATSYSIPIVLSNATTYSWQVRYKNAYDLWSAYSAATTFTTTNATVLPPPPPPPPPPPLPVAPNQPVNYAPAQGAVNVSLRPILMGGPYSHSQGSPQTASQWIMSHAGTNIFDSGTYIAATNYPIANALSDFTIYGFQVRYRDANNLWSDYSQQTTFTTTNSVVLPVPPDPSTNQPPNPGLPPVAAGTTNIVIFRGTIILMGTFDSK